MKSYNEIESLKYGLQDKAIKEWAIAFGIVDLARSLATILGNLMHCGYLGGILIDSNYIAALSDNDKAILNRTYEYIYKL